MTREFYTTRKANLLEEFTYLTQIHRLDDARIVYGRLCELRNIARAYDIISAAEEQADHKEAEDCFYDNL